MLNSIEKFKVVILHLKGIGINANGIAVTMKVNQILRLPHRNEAKMAEIC